MEKKNYLNMNNISLFSNIIKLYPPLLVKGFIDINIYKFSFSKFLIENNTHMLDSIINIE
jgi:hypothetical protein